MSLGAIIVKEFVEGGVSTTARRPALQDMLRYLDEEAAAGRGIDYIIVHTLDRLVRNRYDDTALGRHSKKQPDCTFHATLVTDIEQAVSRLYDRIHLDPTRRQQLQSALQHQLTSLTQQTTEQLQDYTTHRQQLERQRHKLLQAHYADAIDLDTLKTEQTRITRELTTIQRRQAALSQDLTDTQHLIRQARDLAQHAATAYHGTPDHLRRLLNQTLFDKIYITTNQDASHLTTTATHQPPFDSILT
ncbi:recombinase family protein [Actinomyces gaoshouyii]|uniref:Resolvase/invertase-type recombinase catalytic domain-containing protein n=1 Tax=Actinomyces gaoshouyii TaxID=1960083 RepID=A0A8H9HD64_9ACTO|nr:recombinase family protein [Actinomyces gaoshouyii]GGO97744.1 hypothetical protein GCM10011612_11020 [Actinomyces gaoshouyii]